jgi:Isochorismatase family
MPRAQYVHRTRPTRGDVIQRAYGLEVPKGLEEVCDPRRLALIVYDMQIGILGQIRERATLTANVAQVLRAARDAGVRTFFSRHMSLPKELRGVFSCEWRWHGSESAPSMTFGQGFCETLRPFN